MTSFADLKTKHFLKLVKWLGKNKGVTIEQGGRHNIKVTVIYTGQSYPLPTSHSMTNKHIIKDFMEWLVRQGICSEQEFKDKL